MFRSFMIIAFLIAPVAAYAAGPTGAASPQALAEKYQEYHNAKKCDEAFSLFYTEGALPQNVKALYASLCKSFAQPVTKFELKPADEVTKKPIKFKSGVTLIPTLPVEGKVEFSLTNTDPAEHAFHYGKKDGKYYFITSKVLKIDEPAKSDAPASAPAKTPAKPVAKSPAAAPVAPAAPATPAAGR